MVLRTIKSTLYLLSYFLQQIRKTIAWHWPLHGLRRRKRNVIMMDPLEKIYYLQFNFLLFRHFVISPFRHFGISSFKHAQKNTSKFAEPWILQCSRQFYCVIPWHILCVLLTLYGKMAQEWNNNICYLPPPRWIIVKYKQGNRNTWRKYTVTCNLPGKYPTPVELVLFTIRLMISTLNEWY